MEAAVPAEEALVLVEYGFEYRAKDGTLVSIKPNERYVLLKRTNHHWWHVRRSGDARPFYIPAQYVKELPPIATPAPLDPAPQGYSGMDPTTLIPQQAPAFEYRFIAATETEEPERGCPVPRRGSVPGRDSPPVLGSSRAPPSLRPDPPDPVRPSHSLDDLARVTPAPRGAPATGSHGDPPGHARPLGKSRSESLCAPGSDRDVAGRRPGPGHAAQAPLGGASSAPEPKQEARRAPGPAQAPSVRVEPPGAPPVPPAMGDEEPGARQRAQSRVQMGQAQPEPEEPPAPIYLNLQELREAAAAGSAPEEPVSSSSDWETHRDTDTGHLFYYNPVTGKATWDCPFGQAEDGVSPAASPARSPARSPRCSEWEQLMDGGSGQAFFYNWVTGETSWDPPDTGGAQDKHLGGTRHGAMEQRPPTPEMDYPNLSPDELESYPKCCSPMGSYDQEAALCVSPRSPKELGSAPSWFGRSHPEGSIFCPEHLTSDTGPWGRPARASSSSSLDSGALTVLPTPGPREGKLKSLEKAGVLNRTRTVDRGKRIRKNWSSSWTVLEGGILTFFKDSKHSAAGALQRHPSTLTTPEHTLELRGATLAWAGRDKSSKRHVLELRTREGSEFLIQHDSEGIIAAWHKAIADSIRRLGTDLSGDEDAESGAEFGSREKLGGGEEKRAVMGNTSGESDSSRVRNKLRKFLQRRPTLQSLRERGYIKDQVFGCSLQALCERERGTVPRFVLQCIQTVERRGLDIDGLYRVSGNLATIQKLRYKVEHDEQLDLDDGRWEDVHVVTGALKLFLRELPEPLVPFSHFEQFIAAIKMQDPMRRGWCIRELVSSLPPAHHDTMKVLFHHLCRVIEYKEENRMSVQSIAIVFGPTLLHPASEEGSMAMHMVFQNQVVEHILNQYSYIFPDV